MKTKVLAGASSIRAWICFFVAAMSSAAALAEEKPDAWQFQITPYIWLPTIEGSLRYQPPPGGGGGPDIALGPTDWLDLLNAGALVAASAKKGRFSILTDAVYLSLTAKNDGRVISVDDNISVPGTPIKVPVNITATLDSRFDLDGLAWTLAGGYSIKENERSSIDLIAGVRYFGVDTTTSWSLDAAITTPGGTVLLPAEGSTDRDVDLWDGIIGSRGHVRIGEGKWLAQYYFDIGTGSSDLTWTAMGALAYEFGWGDVVLAYRHLEYDQDADGLFQGFSFSGPGLGARFRF